MEGKQSDHTVNSAKPELSYHLQKLISEFGCLWPGAALWTNLGQHCMQ